MPPVYPGVFGRELVVTPRVSACIIRSRERILDKSCPLRRTPRAPLFRVVLFILNTLKTPKGIAWKWGGGVRILQQSHN